jgi:hypothetical protein
MLSKVRKLSDDIFRACLGSSLHGLEITDGRADQLPLRPLEVGVPTFSSMFRRSIQTAPLPEAAQKRSSKSFQRLALLDGN